MFVLTPTSSGTKIAEGRVFALVSSERGETGVRVVYSDESGVGNPDNEPITVVAAAVINIDRSWNAIEAQLYRIVAEAPKNLLADGQSLKGKILYSAVRKNVQPEATIAGSILSQVLEIPTKYGVALFYGAVDRKGLANYQARSVSAEEKSATSYDVAFKRCLERVDAAARAFIDKHERILWIADRSDGKREPATKVSLSSHRFAQRPSDESLEDDFRLTDSCLVDTVYFGNSADSIALQLADVCCSTITLSLLEQFYGWNPCVGEFYERLRLRVMNDGTPVHLREYA
jgi:Protein of unknown function (DUF3800)